jgi:hypothetical protein
MSNTTKKKIKSQNEDRGQGIENRGSRGEMMQVNG